MLDDRLYFEAWRHAKIPPGEVELMPSATRNRPGGETVKILTPRIHGFLDFLVVIVFFLAPLVFNLPGLAAVVSYLLGGVHLVLTLLTASLPGAAEAIPLTVHGAIELLISIVLIVGPLLLPILGIPVFPPAIIFYVGIGLVILVIRLITNYREA
jgi:hypothetical protein